MCVALLKFAGRMWLVLGLSLGMMHLGPITLLDTAGSSYLAVALIFGYPVACLLTAPRRNPHLAPIAVRHKPNHLRLAQVAPAYPQGGGNSHRGGQLAPVHHPLVPAA
jgi:hypothetical protein